MTSLRFIVFHLPGVASDYELYRCVLLP